MKKIVLVLVLIIFIFSCKEKIIDLTGANKVSTKDFFGAFSEIETPYIVADTNINTIKDTLRIGASVLLQFIPDSVLAFIQENKKKMNIYTIGKIEKETEKYLLIKFSFSKNTELYVFVFDKKNKFLNFKNLLSTNNADDYVHAVTINREPTFILSREKNDTEKNQLKYSRIGWAFNLEATLFYTVVTETNEDEKKNNTILNPIDSMPHNNKYSGNYSIDTKNFIALRDGKNNGNYLFFIHFEKNEGKCIGELKGELQMKNKNKAVYADNGDPCVIDFTFIGNELKVKEQGTCGNHRGIKCFFNDTYIRKKEKNKKRQ